MGCKVPRELPMCKQVISSKIPTVLMGLCTNTSALLVEADKEELPGVVRAGLKITGKFLLPSYARNIPYFFRATL